MSIEENKARVRRVWELINARDIESLRGLYTEDYIHHDPAFPDGGTRGFDAYVAAFSGFITAFPDLRVVEDAIAAEGDRVALRWHWTGTNTGDLNGMPPTGKSVNVPATSIFNLANGKLSEAWVEFDAGAMMQQLGLMPAPAAV